MVVHGAYCGTWELIVVVQPHYVARVRALVRSLTNGLRFVRVDAVAVVDIPDPLDVRVEVDGINYLNLVSLIEMKLTAAAPSLNVLVADVGDVQEIIKRRRLPKSFAGDLQPHLRQAFLDVWSRPEEET